MFGGSPISVAAPPRFEASTSIKTSEIAEMRRMSARSSVSGTMSRIAVRLSRNADSTPVTPAIRKTSRQDFPPESCAARTAR